VSRKRLRSPVRLSKRSSAYWRERLFKNTFTYQGRRVEVASWSVKIQAFGTRRAFTLASPDLAQAADEACLLYQTIIERGWEAVAQRNFQRQSSALAEPEDSPDSAAFNVEYWKRRLIQRKYPEPTKSSVEGEFSVRIDHARLSHYFPLGTCDEDEAAAQAMQIYRTIIGRGWASANASYARELSLALRWQDDPLAWTYTTIHTCPASAQTKLPRLATDRAEHSIVFIEPDAGIRRALAAYAAQQDGFRCDATFTDAAEALREIPRQRVDLALANHDLPDEANQACLDELQRLRPGLAVLSYSMFEDADQLFKSTPGGSIIYMLKRTQPWRLFEPIAEMAGPATREQIASHVRNYFQHLSALLPSGPPFWKLAKLTPREHEILAFLSKGDLLKEIADKLGISNWTVQGHVKNIFEKLKVHTRTEAVIKYLQK